MEIIVIDASVLVKWFINESDSKYAIWIRNQYIEGTIKIIAPDLILYEVLNALKYSKIFDEKELKEISQTIIEYGITRYSFTKDLINTAIELAINNNLTIYDASYLSLAIHQKGILITADEKLLNNIPAKYKKYGMTLNKIKNPN
ncbi:MAG: type II toxin-antitoxin system VapC family toxin [Candidatus Heimdallarchaeaceae archaeon]